MNRRTTITITMLALAVIIGPADAALRSTADRSGVDGVHILADPAQSVLVSPLCWHVDSTSSGAGAGGASSGLS